MKVGNSIVKVLLHTFNFIQSRFAPFSPIIYERMVVCIYAEAVVYLVLTISTASSFFLHRNFEHFKSMTFLTSA